MKKYCLATIVSLMLIFAISCQQFEQTEEFENINGISGGSENYSGEFEEPEYLSHTNEYIGAHGGSPDDDCIHGGQLSSFHRYDAIMEHIIGREAVWEWERRMGQKSIEYNNPDCASYFVNIVQ